MIKFGTSGWRAIIGEDYTKENVQKVAAALAKISKSDLPIPVGFDNRFMGKQFAMWLVEALAGQGKKVKFFSEAVPSPLIGFEAVKSEFGIMISASHNPYYYNGIKIFQTGGRELTKQQNERLEKLANRMNGQKLKTVQFEQAKKRGLVVETKNFGPYISSIIKNVDAKAIRDGHLKIYFNAMQGSATAVAKQLFAKLGADVVYLNDDVNPNFKFGVPAPYNENLGDQKSIAKRDGTEHFGFALDGDGDRISFVDENGKFYDCNYVAALVYEQELLDGRLGSVVKNCAMTTLIDKIAEGAGQSLRLAEVGFKNTAVQMITAGDAILGAESNGFAINGHILYKDGLMAGAKVMEVLAKMKKPLSKAVAALKKKYHYPSQVVEYAYPFTASQRAYIEKTVFQQKTLPKIKGLEIVSTSYADGLKINYAGGYWGVIRFSGNENVIRLFAEMPTLDECDKVISAYEKLIKLKTRQN